MTEKLLTYALGRGLEHTTCPGARHPPLGRARGLPVLGARPGIARSAPFQMRTVEAGRDLHLERRSIGAPSFGGRAPHWRCPLLDAMSPQPRRCSARPPCRRADSVSSTSARRHHEPVDAVGHGAPGLIHADLSRSSPIGYDLVVGEQPDARRCGSNHAGVSVVLAHRRGSKRTDGTGFPQTPCRSSR